LFVDVVIVFILIDVRKVRIFLLLAKWMGHIINNLPGGNKEIAVKWNGMKFEVQQ